MNFEQILNKNQHTPEELLFLMKADHPSQRKLLHEKAYEIKTAHTGGRVFLRGVIEIGNICAKNCLYCGIRRDQKDLARYSMTEEEILETAKWAVQFGYRSLVLQGGERYSSHYGDFIEEIIKKIIPLAENPISITLSLGEQSEDIYQRWREAGARRYLLRIETSNPALYQKLHPSDHDFETRVQCLKTLRKLDYQTGTGVMIGLPGQTDEDLINDILFYETNDIDMIGMGPYVVSAGTPLAEVSDDSEAERNRRLDRSLAMIALTRIHLKDVNIASTTALQTLHPAGREAGLKAGANVMMPIITPLKYRSSYQLYDGKPCLGDTPESCRFCIEGRINSIGETAVFGPPGDSLHYQKRNLSEAK